MASPPAATLLRQYCARYPAKQIPVNMESFDEQISQTALRDRMTATLAGFFGCLALLLASIGLYGIMSYTVIRRTSELGIRMALGSAGCGRQLDDRSANAVLAGAERCSRNPGGAPVYPLDQIVFDDAVWIGADGSGYDRRH